MGERNIAEATRKAERADIVAWLRKLGAASGHWIIADTVARAIERGDHIANAGKLIGDHQKGEGNG